MREPGVQKRGAGAPGAQAEGAPADNYPPHSHLPQGANEDRPGPHGQHRQVTKATVGGAGYFSRKGCGEQPAASLASAVRTLEKLTTSVITARPHSISDFIFLSGQETVSWEKEVTS